MELHPDAPQLVLPQPETDKYPKLPPELILLIIPLLSRQDQQKFCLLSQSYRQLTLPALFRKVRYSQEVEYQITRFNEARGDVKAAIKELVLSDTFNTFWNYESVLFPFLRSLPNLQSFRWWHSRRLSQYNQGFLQLVASLQHCPLEHFTYWVPHHPEEHVTAPPQLKSLSVKFHHDQVYDFIRPSFSTLVELELYPGSVTFDLVPLRPVGGTLRKLVYKCYGFDPAILDTIPDVFPYLTTLELAVRNTTLDFRWKNSYDDAIAKNTKLQYLALFAERFVFCERDPQWAHIDCKKCGKQRVQATRALAMACTGLKYCMWHPTRSQYCFNVRLSRKSSEGNTLVRVKRAAEFYTASYTNFTSSITSHASPKPWNAGRQTLFLNSKSRNYTINFFPRFNFVADASLSHIQVSFLLDDTGPLPVYAAKPGSPRDSSSGAVFGLAPMTSTSFQGAELVVLSRN